MRRKTRKFLNAAFLVDGYKLLHHLMYPEGTEVVFSTFTARSNKYATIKGANGVVIATIQYVISDLVDRFDRDFFMTDQRKWASDEELREMKAEVIDEIAREFTQYTGMEYATQHFSELWDLGYLPIEIRSMDEGTVCPIKVPYLTIHNTDKRFYWVTNYLETIISNMIWPGITTATTIRGMRTLVNDWAIKTTGSTEGTDYQLHDFSMRGLKGVDNTILSGIAFLTSSMGSDNIPAIPMIRWAYGDEGNIANGVPACYDSETEILTNKGWKFFKDLDKTELVAQFNEDESIEFVKPLEYFADKYKGKLIHFYKENTYKTVDMMVTPNHRMVYKNTNKKKNTIHLIEAQQTKFKSVYSPFRCLITGGIISNEIETKLTPLERLKIAFQADGSFPSREEAYTGEVTNSFPIRFSLKKERKKERLVSILDELGVEYTLNKYENGYYSFWVKLEEKLVKDFSWVDLETLNKTWCDEFINELLHWDGTQKNNSILYSSTNKECIDVIQSIAVLSGNRAHFNEYEDKRDDHKRKINYSLTLTLDKSTYSSDEIIEKEIDYDGIVYCVSVPSKMIVVRRNGRVAISGNTEHSIMTSEGVDGEIGIMENLVDKFPNGFLSIVSDSYDYWENLTAYIPSLKAKILGRDGRYVVRPDSGNVVHIICGTVTDIREATPVDELLVDLEDEYWDYCSTYLAEENAQLGEFVVYKKVGEIYYKVTVKPEYGKTSNSNTGDDIEYLDNVEIDIEEVEATAEMKGSIEVLWDIFGGTTNDLGYKVLNDKIGLIYGESINYEKAGEIFEILANKGFASTNVVMGCGSYMFSMTTRDSYGQAIKSTYQVRKGVGKNIFKDPKTDDGTKKSAKGLTVARMVDGHVKLFDEQTWDDVNSDDNLLKVRFRNGEFINESYFTEVRERTANADIFNV